MVGTVGAPGPGLGTSAVNACHTHVHRSHINILMHICSPVHVYMKAYFILIYSYDCAHAHEPLTSMDTKCVYSRDNQIWPSNQNFALI